MAGGYVDPSQEFAKLIFLIPIALWVGAAMWVLWDSVQRTGEWGWVWGVLAFGMAPIVVPVYIIAVVIATRPAPAWVQREKELEKEAVSKMRGMTEFQRVKYLEDAKSGGTLYSGGGLQPHNRGAQHFADAEAEQLIGLQQHDSAFIYLYDLYSLAVQGADPRAEQTYRYYIGQLPDGLALLHRAQERGITPAQLQAGGMDLLSETLAVRTVGAGRREETDAAAPLMEDDNGSASLAPAAAPKPLRPVQKPLAVAAPANPRAPRRPTVPF